MTDQEFWDELASNFDLDSMTGHHHTNVDSLSDYQHLHQFTHAQFNAVNCDPALLAPSSYSHGLCPPDFFSPQLKYEPQAEYEPRIAPGLDSLFLEDVHLPWDTISYNCSSSRGLYQPQHSQYPSANTDNHLQESSANSSAPSGDETGQQTDTSVADVWVPEDVYSMGYQDEEGQWKCKHDGCLSKKVFTRACDLRKHYRSHQKLFFCSEIDCPWFRIGFSSRKDCRRHKASHEPNIRCPVDDCDRVFSRVDNMVSPQRLQELNINEA